MTVLAALAALATTALTGCSGPRRRQGHERPDHTATPIACTGHARPLPHTPDRTLWRPRPGLAWQ
ncbi:hypothetical protein SHIRM173S_03183 [Streptomyces hirsutus]